jgi:hypothetical protein
MSKVLFNGKVLREPRAATQLRVGIPPTVNPDATNRVLVIGPSEGGLPVADNTVYTFSNHADARDILRSGDALRAIRMIFNPSPSFGGAAQVDFIRMDQATASSLIIADGTAGTALTLTSKDKGTWTNLLRVSLAAGTAVPANRVLTVQVPDTAIQSGTDGVVTGTTTFTSVTAKFKSRGAKAGDYLWLSNGTAGAQVFAIVSVDSETQVTLAGATAGTGVSWFHYTYSRTQVSPELPTNTELALWIQSELADVLSVTVGAGTLAAVLATPKNLTGGTVTAGTNTQITQALALARDLDVRHIFVARTCGTTAADASQLDFGGLLSGHIANDAEVPAHAYVGAAANLTNANAKIYAGLLNNARLVYCSQTIIDRTEDGLSVEELPGMFLAAKVCGLAAGLPAQTPLTRKPIDVQGIKVLVADGKLDRVKREDLLKAGVCHVFQAPGTTTWVINQGIATIQKQDLLWDASTSSSPEISLTRIADTLLYNMRKSAQEQFIGTTASLGKAVVENWARSYLESERGNLITDWRNLVVIQNADQWEVQFGFIPNNPINYVLITGTVIG